MEFVGKEKRHIRNLYNIKCNKNYKKFIYGKGLKIGIANETGGEESVLRSCQKEYSRRGGFGILA